MKRLVFCSDGTSNTEKNRTNVFQVFSMLAEHRGQLKAYDRGVGVGFGNVLRGCAFGVGLHLNILDASDSFHGTISPGTASTCSVSAGRIYGAKPGKHDSPLRPRFPDAGKGISICSGRPTGPTGTPKSSENGPLP